MMYKPSHNKANPWFKLLALIGFLCVGAFIGYSLIILFIDLPGQTLQELALNTSLYKNYLLISQLILTSSMFIAAPLLYWILIEKQPIQYFFQGKQPYIRAAILTLGLVSSFIFVNEIFIYWNLHLKLPDFLKGFEQWAQTKEAEFKEVTKLLSTFSSTQELLISLFVMAFLPAIGEEFLFRGLIQNLFHKITKNIHLAITISALIFTTIHFQFYGFLPRFLFGLLFGYIYWWTKDLSLVILAHFFNNAFVVIISFLQQKAWIPDTATSIQLPSLWLSLFFSLTSFIFAKILHRLSRSSYPEYP